MKIASYIISLKFYSISRYSMKTFSYNGYSTPGINLRKDALPDIPLSFQIPRTKMKEFPSRRESHEDLMKTFRGPMYVIILFKMFSKSSYIRTKWPTMWVNVQMFAYSVINMCIIWIITLRMTLNLLEWLCHLLMYKGIKNTKRTFIILLMFHVVQLLSFNFRLFTKFTLEWNNRAMRITQPILIYMCIGAVRIASTWLQVATESDEPLHATWTVPIRQQYSTGSSRKITRNPGILVPPQRKRRIPRILMVSQHFLY